MNIDAILSPLHRKARNHVMWHMFHIHMGRALLHAGFPDNRRIGLMGRNDLVPHRMVKTCRGQIRRIKRLIHNGEIITRTKGVHHCRAEIAGAGPHCDTHFQILILLAKVIAARTGW